MNKMQYFLSILLLFFASQMNAQTIEQLRDSMAAGNLNYQVVLACKYIDGDGIEPDTLEAIRLLKDAVEKGNQFGELWLGACYTFGVGVEKDLTKAFHCYLSSAEKGNLAAMNNVGEAYEYGRGVEQNMKEAVNYYQKASDNQFSPALINLASCYEYGKGVDLDLAKSFSLLKQACDKDNDDARFLIAKYYFNGWGTDVNKEEALRIMNSLKESRYGEVATILASRIEKGDSMSTYELQFRYIPDLLFSYQKGETDYSELVNPSKWEWSLRSIFVSHFEWDWHQVTCSIHAVDDSTDVVLYRMEEPKEIPLCLYMAAVVDKNRHHCRYYTLEKSQSYSDKIKDLWVMGGVAENMGHHNYGFIDGRVSEEEFLKKVKKLRESKPIISSNKKNK